MEGGKKKRAESLRLMAIVLGDCLAGGCGERRLIWSIWCKEPVLGVEE